MKEGPESKNSKTQKTDKLKNSKTDKMAKDWKIVAKMQNWKVLENWEICAM